MSQLCNNYGNVFDIFTQMERTSETVRMNHPGLILNQQLTSRTVAVNLP